MLHFVWAEGTGVLWLWVLNQGERRESCIQNSKGGGSVVWGLWWLQLRVRCKVWAEQAAVCLQVKAEAAQRKGLRDNTVKRSAPDAQTFYSLLPGVHLMSLEWDCCLFSFRARVLAGDSEELPALHSTWQGQSCYNLNGSVPPESIQIEPLLARLHSACFLV